MRGRREVLASLGSALTLGLAGCGTVAPSEHRSQAPASAGTPPKSPRSTPAVAGGLRVTAADTGSDGLDWSVEKRAAATEEHPCELRIAVENTGRPRELTVDGPMPFPPTRGARTDDGTEGVVAPAIVPIEGEFERRFGGDCWQAPLDDPKLADDAPWNWGPRATQTLALDPGDRFEGRYAVVADWTRFCFQRGEYRFRRRYELAGTADEWAFRLHVPAYDRRP